MHGKSHAPVQMSVLPRAYDIHIHLVPIRQKYYTLLECKRKILNAPPDDQPRLFNKLNYTGRECRLRNCIAIKSTQISFIFCVCSAVHFQHLVHFVNMSSHALMQLKGTNPVCYCQFTVLSHMQPTRSPH